MYRKEESIACILVAVTVLVFPLTGELLDMRNYKISDLNRFRGIPIEANLEYRIKELQDYIVEKEANNIKVVIADECAAICMIPLDKYTKNFDMLLVGNLGTQSVEELLAENKGAIYLVVRDEEKLGYQAHFELIRYIKEHYIKIDEVHNFDAYKEKRE